MPDSIPEPFRPSCLRVIVASKNPVKVAAARRGFTRVLNRFRKIGPENLEVVGLSVPSGVSDQPFNDAETLRGARQRADGAQELAPEADFWVGMEGGIEEQGDVLYAGAWIVILGKNGEGRSRTANFPLPQAVSRRVQGGLELGSAIDQVFNRQGAKKGPGAAGLLTLELIGRTDLYEPSVILALAPFMLPRVYDHI